MYCDVALPVPLDRAFTYELGGLEAEVGARVMVPFGGQRLVGVVVGLHDVSPGEDVEVKRVQQVMDEAALLSDELMELGKWVAAYYCAPLGEVLRGMMPLTAEVRRQWVYRIAEQGRKVLYEGGEGVVAAVEAECGGPEPRVRGAELSGEWRGRRRRLRFAARQGRTRRCWMRWRRSGGWCGSRWPRCGMLGGWRSVAVLVEPTRWIPPPQRR